MNVLSRGVGSLSMLPGRRKPEKIERDGITKCFGKTDGS